MTRGQCLSIILECLTAYSGIVKKLTSFLLNANHRMNVSSSYVGLEESKLAKNYWKAWIHFLEVPIKPAKVIESSVNGPTITGLN